MAQKFLDLLFENKYFELHEELEAIWLQVQDKSLKLQIQGVIQLSVALYHWENNNLKGVEKLTKLACEKLNIQEKLTTEKQVFQIIHYYLKYKLKLD